MIKPANTIFMINNVELIRSQSNQTQTIKDNERALESAMRDVSTLEKTIKAEEQHLNVELNKAIPFINDAISRMDEIIKGSIDEVTNANRKNIIKTLRADPKSKEMIEKLKTELKKVTNKEHYNYQKISDAQAPLLKLLKGPGLAGEFSGIFTPITLPLNTAEPINKKLQPLKATHEIYKSAVNAAQKFKEVIELIKKANDLWKEISPEMNKMNEKSYTFDASKLKNATELMQLTSDISAKLDYANTLNLKAQNKSTNNNSKEITELLTLCTNFASDAKGQNDTLQNSTEGFRNKFGYLLTDAYRKKMTENEVLKASLQETKELTDQIKNASKIFQQETKGLQEIVKDQEASINNLTATKDKLDKDLQVAKSTLDKVKSDAEDIQKKLNEAESSNSEQVKNLKVDLLTLEKTKEKKENELQSQLDQAKKYAELKLKNTIDANESAIKKLQDELNEAKSAADAKEDALEVQLDQANRETEQTREELKTLNLELKKAQEDAKTETKRLQATLDEAKSDAENTRKELETLQEEKKDMERKDAELTKLNSEIETNKRALDKEQKILKEKQKKYNEITIELRKAQDELVILKKSVQDIEM